MSAPLLSLRDFSVAFGDRTVVDAISFDVAPGEIVALVGESGSGKTMAARALIDLLPPDARRSGGSALFRDVDLGSLDGEAMRGLRGAGIGMIFQEPMTSLDPSMAIGQQMVEGLRHHRALDETEARAQAAAMLARVQVADPEAALDRYPYQFSGGMRQRISIAAAMLLEPALLIADEPTTALDVIVQREVLDLLVSMTREAATGVLLITHDLGLVAQYADRIVVMQRGRLVETGVAAAMLARPQQAYTQALLGALPHRSSRPLAPGEGEDLVRIDNVHVHLTGKRALPWLRAPVMRSVNGISLRIARGEMVAIVGESGSGKTTLVRTILQLVQVAEGTIHFEGQEITRLTGAARRAFRRRVRIVFQDPFSALDPRMRIEDLIAEGMARDPGANRADRRARVIAMLEEVGLPADFARRFPHQLSGGQRQRVNIARALIADPELLIADEPVSALDVTVQAEILALLERLKAARGFACIFISHSLGVVEQIADRVVVLHRGRVIEEGSRDDIFDDPRHPYTCALLAAAPRLQSDGAGGYRLQAYAPTPPAAPAGYAYAAWQGEDRRFGDAAAQVAPMLVDVAPGHKAAMERC